MSKSENKSSDSGDERLVVSTDGPVCTIEMNAPDKRNPYGFAMSKELKVAFDEAASNDDIKVIILGGLGKVFSAGHDLSPEGLKEYIDSCSTPEDMWQQCEENFFRNTGLDIWSIDKPTIARVQGAAVMGAFSLANVCDLIVAADDAIFWTPGARMHSFAAEVFMEPWVMSARRAKEHLFTGDPMSAEEAYRVGMVNRVVPPEELNQATMALAQHIAKQPALGLKLAKRAVNNTLENQGFRAALEFSFLLHIFSKATRGYQEDMWKPLLEKIEKEGLASYLDKRDSKS